VRHPLAFALATLIFASAALAQPTPPAGPGTRVPPALMVKVKEASEQLGLRTVKVDARIVGHLAETRMTMTFYNPHDRALAGDLYFPLPEGATVSGYALDIAGAMVDGVVVPKAVARQVFEKEVRKGIDPGLVEWVGGSNFKTRVFPIPAKGTRTIMVRYVAEVEDLGQGATYLLPLRFRDKLQSFSVRVEVVKAAAKPVIAAGGPQGLEFASWRDSFVAEASLKDSTLTEDLQVRLPALEKSPVRVETAPDGKTYFVIRDHVAATAGGDAAKPQRVAVVWDASGSRASADHKREIALLDAYLATLGDIRVDLVLLRNKASRPKTFSLPAQKAVLADALRAVQYDGGTQLGALAPIRGLKKPDLMLVFSDGISNFGTETPGVLPASYFFNSATTASHAALRALALQSGGAYFNLTRLADADVLPRIGKGEFGFISATIDGKRAPATWPRIPQPVAGAFTLAGQLTGDSAVIEVAYGSRGQISERRRFTITRSDATPGDLLRRHWAQKKVDDLMVSPKRNARRIADVGMEFEIVTPGTSLIVLETLEQYVEHDIRPPASLAKMRHAWDNAVAQRQASERAEEKSKLEHVIRLWKQRVAWYEKKFKYPKNFRYGRSPAKKSVGAPMARVARPASQSARPDMDTDGAPDEVDDEEKAESPDKSKGKAAPDPEPSIKITPWDPKTPYVAALKAAARAKHVSVYMTQRAEHGTSPAFFLDCAEFFRKAGDGDMALQVLSNIAELELEDAALIRILAHRLAQLEHLTLSIRLFERARELRPEEPQSHRDLALVLSRRAEKGDGAQAAVDYSRAIKLLTHVVMNKWDRFAEIELMALTELNNIIPRARKARVDDIALDPRLIKPLKLDVRIVMTWDADLTDMDMHVVEPSEEEAYYGHNKTTIGGIVSRDFTRGYGPEVYLVRKAMKGVYKVRTKYFGSSSAKLAGAVTLQVDIFTNYGRKNQKRQSITFRLTESKETFTVGEIKF